jgi:hypothetical protein
VCLLLIANVVILNTPLVSCYKLYESPFLLIFARKKYFAISYIYYSLPFSLDDFYPSIPSFLFVIGCVILLVYYVVGYRKKTVRANIALALI